MLEELKKEVLEANLELPARGLVVYTWGNVSGIDRDKGLVVIKPSGVPYETLQMEHLAVLELDSGRQVEGMLRPSSDTASHLEIYRGFPEIGGIVHTHSKWAATWAQAGKDIPAFGTTHADYYYGAIPCTRQLPDAMIEQDYEANVGKVIVETIKDMKRPAGIDGTKDVNPLHMPAILVRSHGPFTWGRTVADAVHSAVVLEETAMMAYHSIMLSPELAQIDQALLDVHYLRKHGPKAHYGQNR